MSGKDMLLLIILRYFKATLNGGECRMNVSLFDHLKMTIPQKGP